MKKIALVLVLAATEAVAQSRPLTTAMTCAQVKTMVSSRIAVVMSLSPTTYDKIVSDHRGCLYSEALIPIYVRTKDSNSCFAGYTCREGDFWIN